jgi:hypothetical protein
MVLQFFIFPTLKFPEVLTISNLSLDQEPTLDPDPYSQCYSKSNLPLLVSFEMLSHTSKKLALSGLGTKLTYANMMFQYGRLPVELRIFMVGCTIGYGTTILTLLTNGVSQTGKGRKKGF